MPFASGWYIPLHTVREDPSLLHWTGLSGEENREKLARTFKRPVSFLEYCEEVSLDNCTSPDEHAARYPIRSENPYENDGWRYFVPDVYTGYFRYTDQNNCTANKDNCTGHIVDFPCGWSSFTEAQAYHMNIALQSNGPSGPIGGYWDQQMQDIWRAANATQEHVIMHWEDPHVLVYEFRSSNFSFQRVTLPFPTQECQDARRPNKLRCAVEQDLRVGEPEGVCDESAEAKQKIFSTALRYVSKGDHIKEAFKSPAYDALRAFQLSNLQLGQIFDLYVTGNWSSPFAKRGFGMRDSVCEWVVENIEDLVQFVPTTYPRQVKTFKRDVASEPFKLAAIICALVSIVMTVLVFTAVVIYRRKAAIKRALLEFLFLLLAGIMFVSLGSLSSALPVTEARCIVSVWLTNVGYTLELVPLVVKQAALNHILRQSQVFRRTVVRKKSLYKVSATIVAMVVVVLIAWTIVDPPTAAGSYNLEKSETGIPQTVLDSLLGEENGDVLGGNPQGENGFYIVPGSGISFGDTTIVETLHCKSKDWSHWWTLFAGWQALNLLIAAVLAYQSRGMREDVVETKTLAMMIYNHILFLVLRTTTFILQAQDSTEDQLMFQWIRSILNSADVLMTLSIYFLPKFFLQPVRRRGSEGSFDTLQGGWQDTTFRRRVVEESSDGGGIPISFDTSGSKRSSSGKSKSRNSSSTPDVLQSTQENVMESGGARSQGQSYNSEGSSAGLTTHTDVGTHSVESDADARVDYSRAK